jgi:hypothetical protein
MIIYNEMKVSSNDPCWYCEPRRLLIQSGIRLHDTFRKYRARCSYPRLCGNMHTFMTRLFIDSPIVQANQHEHKFRVWKPKAFNSVCTINGIEYRT